MQVYISAKTIGKRKGYMELVPYELDEGITTVEKLIEAVVSIEVQKFKDRQTKSFVGFLNEAAIADQIDSGKVSYGTVYNDKEVNLETAKTVAKQAFMDGIVMLILNDLEVTDIKQTITLLPNDQLTFIRLTFLAGRLW